MSDIILLMFLITSAISCGSTVGLQNRQMKEALFIKKVQQNVKEEQANHLRWQVRTQMYKSVKILVIVWRVALVFLMH